MLADAVPVAAAIATTVNATLIVIRFMIFSSGSLAETLELTLVFGSLPHGAGASAVSRTNET
jgi:hypothetical protein